MHALTDLSGGNITDRVRSEQYFNTAGLSMEGKLTPYIAQLLNQTNEEIRLPAIRIIINTGGVEAIPYFISFLESGNPMIRHDAFEKLKLITNIDLGYAYDDLPGQRAAAVERWREWYKTNFPVGK